jgi:hypothetical protein
MSTTAIRLSILSLLALKAVSTPTDYSSPDATYSPASNSDSGPGSSSSWSGDSSISSDSGSWSAGVTGVASGETSWSSAAGGWGDDAQVSFQSALRTTPANSNQTVTSATTITVSPSISPISHTKPQHRRLGAHTPLQHMVQALPLLPI